MLALQTHKNPLKNLHTTSIPKLVDKLEKRVEMKDNTSVGTITLFRPLLSAKNPHMCELAIIPIDVTPESTPLC